MNSKGIFRETFSTLICMKTLLSILISLYVVNVTAQTQAVIELQGAWQREADGNKMIMICSEKYFAAAVYASNDKKFVGTCGGSWRIDGNKFHEVHEFNTMHPDYIGKELTTEISIKNSELIFTVDGKKESWKRIDNNRPGLLAGAWLITGRMNENAMQSITPGARRTMKILSGTRFQWIAYNVDTKEFFGTGGGTYTTQNGKYTENIDFFSRDNSRIGMSLTFDFSIEDGNWHHKGLSSKGDPIDEVWTKREKLGL
jgi:hypothetical protein